MKKKKKVAKKIISDLSRPLSPNYRNELRSAVSAGSGVGALQAGRRALGKFPTMMPARRTWSTLRLKKKK